MEIRKIIWAYPFFQVETNIGRVQGKYDHYNLIATYDSISFVFKIDDINKINDYVIKKGIIEQRKRGNRWQY